MKIKHGKKSLWTRTLVVLLALTLTYSGSPRTYAADSGDMAESSVEEWQELPEEETEDVDASTTDDFEETDPEAEMEADIEDDMVSDMSAEEEFEELEETAWMEDEETEDVFVPDETPEEVQEEEPEDIPEETTKEKTYSKEDIPDEEEEDRSDDGGYKEIPKEDEIFYTEDQLEGTVYVDEETSEEARLIAEELAGQGDMEDDPIPIPYMEVENIPEFRFMQVDAITRVIPDGTVIRASKDSDGLAVGVADGDSEVCLLDKGSEWSFVESGYVRGFVPTDSLSSGSASGRVAATMNPMDNPAFASIKKTAMDVIAEKDYAIADTDLGVFDSKSIPGTEYWSMGNREASLVGVIPAGGLAYVLADADDSVVFVESGDVRGFVDASFLEMGSEAQGLVEDSGEDSFSQASDGISWEDNRALYYTVASVKESTLSLRLALIDFAEQFIGNPYVWGGNSLTAGIDCSGFVHEVYSHFGYDISRQSADLREDGKSVGLDVSNALPGDIICYNGHVALYIGDEQIVHASNHHEYPRGGIKISSVYILKILSIRRIIE